MQGLNDTGRVYNPSLHYAGDDRTIREVPLTALTAREEWRAEHGGIMVADIFPSLRSNSFGFRSMSAHIVKKIYYADVAALHLLDIHLRMQSISSRILLRDGSEQAAKRMGCVLADKTHSVDGRCMAYHLCPDSKSVAPLKLQDALFAARCINLHKQGGAKVEKIAGDYPEQEEDRWGHLFPWLRKAAYRADPRVLHLVAPLSVVVVEKSNWPQLPHLLNSLAFTMHNDRVYVGFQWLKGTTNEHGVDLVALATAKMCVLVRTCFLNDKKDDFPACLRTLLTSGPKTKVGIKMGGTSYKRTRLRVAHGIEVEPCIDLSAVAAEHVPSISVGQWGFKTLLKYFGPADRTSHDEQPAALSDWSAITNSLNQAQRLHASTDALAAAYFDAMIPFKVAEQANEREVERAFQSCKQTDELMGTDSKVACGSCGEEGAAFECLDKAGMPLCCDCTIEFYSGQNPAPCMCSDEGSSSSASLCIWCQAHAPTLPSVVQEATSTSEVNVASEPVCDYKGDLFHYIMELLEAAGIKHSSLSSAAVALSHILYMWDADAYQQVCMCATTI